MVSILKIKPIKMEDIDLNTENPFMTNQLPNGLNEYEFNKNEKTKE